MSSSTRERRLWLGAALCLALIYGSAFVARSITEVLREQGLLRVAVGGVFVGAAGLAVRWIVRRRPARRTLFALLVVAGLYLLLLAWLYRTSVPEECVHLLEYGVLSGLIYGALVERRRRQAAPSPGSIREWVPALGAIALTALLGWGDEIIQFWLPERYYDTRDIALNALAGLLAVVALEVIRRSRRLEPRRDPV